MTISDARARISPFVGPRPFQNEDSEWFFGREREARELEAIVISKPLVLFYAQSGAGKTSLINTKLVPALEKENFEVLVGRVSGGAAPPGVEPKNIYVYNLILNLVDEGTSIDLSTLAGLTLAQFLNFLNRKQNESGKYIYFFDETYAPTEILPRTLIIDQFEEVLTTHPEVWDQRADFFKQLRKAMEEDPYLGVVLSMREDYVGRLDAFYAQLLPGKLRDRYYMARMNKKAAKRAIMLPPKRAVQEYKMGREFEPETAEQLVRHLSYIKTDSRAGGSEIEGPDVEPVQLQVICQHIWDNLKDDGPDPITLQDIRNLAKGGNLKHLIDNSLSSFYEESLSQILRKSEFRVSEVDLRDWFNKNLITESETRGTVYRGENKTAGLDNQVIDFLVNEAYLLREENRGGGTWYELTHDRFIEPILQANHEWLANQPLIKLAQRWTAADEEKKANYLLGSKQLASFKATNYQALGELAVTFIEASEADQEQKREAYIAREAKQKEREKKLMAEKAQEAEQRARAAEQLAREQKKVRNLFLVIVVIVTLMLVGAIFSRISTGRNLEAAKTAIVEREAALDDAAVANATAEAARTEAQQALTDEIAAKATAVAALERETIASLRADALKLANDLLRGKVTDPELQVLLATLAVSKTRSLTDVTVPDAEQALRQVIWAHRLERAEVSQLPHEGPVGDVEFHPDGQRLVTIGGDETATIWNIRSGRKLASFDTHYSGLGDDYFVLPVALSKGGDYLATPTDDGKTATIWAVDSEEKIATLSDKEGGIIWRLAFGGDQDQYLAIGDDKGQIVIWDWDAPEIFHRLSGHKDGVSGLAFNPDSSRLASASKDNTVWLWDFIQGTPVYSLTEHSGWVNRVTFSPDGSRLASAADDGKIKIFDANTGNLMQSLEAGSEYVHDVAFVQTSTDNLYLAGVDGGPESLGKIKFWQWQDQNKGWTELGTLLTYEDEEAIVWNIAFAPNGEYLATAGSDGTTRLRPLPSDDIKVLYDEACQHTNRNFTYEEFLNYETEISDDPNASLEEKLLSTLLCSYPPDPSILIPLLEQKSTDAELEAFLRKAYQRIGQNFDQEQVDQKIAEAQLFLVNRHIRQKAFEDAWRRLSELEQRGNYQQFDQSFTVDLAETYQAICIAADRPLFLFKWRACTKTENLLNQVGQGQQLDERTKATLAALNLTSCIAPQGTNSPIGSGDAPCQQAGEWAREIKPDQDKIPGELIPKLGTVYRFQITEPNTTVRIRMDAAGNSEAGINSVLSLYNLKGESLDSSDSQRTPRSLISSYTLSQPGAYLVHIEDFSGGAGHYELSLNKEQQKTLRFNQPVSGHTADFTRWVFTNTVTPQPVALTITFSQTVQELAPSLTDPEGGQISELDEVELPSKTHLMVLTKEGKHGFFIENDPASDSSTEHTPYSLRLTELTPRFIRPGEAQEGQLKTGDPETWRFRGDQLEAVTITITGTEPVSSLQLYDPQGNQISTGQSTSDSSIRLTGATPISGSYLILIQGPDSIATGPYTITLAETDPPPGQPLGGPLTGHTGAVTSVAFGPDGTRLVSGSADGALRLWDTEIGQSLGGPLTGHDAWVNSVAFSPDGREIASGSDDTTVRLWDATTGDEVMSLSGHTGWIWTVAFSPDGTQVVSGSEDGTLRLWDVENGKPIGEPWPGHEGSVLSAAFSPDGAQVVSGSEDGTLRRWTGR